jgi:ComF family protein
MLPGTCLLCDLPQGPVPNLCAACARELPYLDRQRNGRLVAFAYEAPVSTLIHWMKFEARLSAALTLGVLLAERIQQAMAASGATLPDAIVPVPLHASRLRARGFNQALELARPLARRLRRPLLGHACLRRRATLAQSSLDAAADRRRNVAGAFCTAMPLTGLQRVAIVDDVITTGATLEELARTLRAAAVREVLAWACAGRPPR